MRKALLGTTLIAAAALVATSAAAIDLGASVSTSGSAGAEGASVSTGAQASTAVNTTGNANAGGASSSGHTVLTATADSDASAEIAVAAEVTGMIGARVITADAVKVGTVNAVAVNAMGEPEAVYTRVGGFLGFGGTDISFLLAAATYVDGTVQLPATKAQIDAFIEAGGSAQADLASASDLSMALDANGSTGVNAALAAQ